MLKIIIIFLLFTTFIHANETKIAAEENLICLGVQVSQGISTETLSNETGSKEYDYRLTSVKVILGQDFDFYRMGMQTSRLQLGYKYSALDSDVSYKTVSLGYQENMRYWSFLDEGDHHIYPLASVDLGYASINNEALSAKGLSIELGLGVAYRYRDVDFSLAFVSTYIDWNHPEEGVADYMLNNQIALGMTYRFMD